ncbi:Interleukin-1 receptor accessory protein [Oryzias melastigma]|uniref:Soluble interferon alpha/beta receptor OPG204 n=1 Tax=Oryzias melastigma TaxID=30732 RepID=A0A834FEU6_ORYME|nr:Interleukin-1 receptor accessory protein [Oryzias melastigma]
MAMVIRTQHWVSSACGIRMKLPFTTKATLGCLCLLLVANGFQVSGDGSLMIIGPEHTQIEADPGEPLVLHCDVFTKSDMDETLIYWLVNDSFPEDTSSHDRIIESKESSLEKGSILHKSLLLKNITAEDFNSTFCCVVTTAEEVVQKSITLKAATRGCGGNKRKRS